MTQLMQKLIVGVILSSSFNIMAAQRFKLSAQQMEHVIHIANAINLLNPKLEESKYLEYAMGIHKAALKYGVDPAVLIAITQQETSFREGLPEGAAGEIGICQIRKLWLGRTSFKKEFNKQTINDLKKPQKSFLFAAWILRELQKSTEKGTLPYWSYYNSVRFENRLKYFLGVNRYLSVLNEFDPSKDRLIAVANANRSQHYNSMASKSHVPERWVSDASTRLKKQRESRLVKLHNTKEVSIALNTKYQNVRATRSPVQMAVAKMAQRRAISNTLIRAAVEWDTSALFEKPIQD